MEIRSFQNLSGRARTRVRAPVWASTARALCGLEHSFIALSLELDVLFPTIYHDALSDLYCFFYTPTKKIELFSERFRPLKRPCLGPHYSGTALVLELIYYAFERARPRDHCLSSGSFETFYFLN